MTTKSRFQKLAGLLVEARDWRGPTFKDVADNLLLAIQHLKAPLSPGGRPPAGESYIEKELARVSAALDHDNPAAISDDDLAEIELALDNLDLLAVDFLDLVKQAREDFSAAVAEKELG